MQKTAYILSILIAVLAALAAIGGLALNIYRDNSFVTTAWRGNDAITLVLGVLPQAMPAMDAFKMVGGLNSGFPDLEFEVQQVTVNGNQAAVKAKVSGTTTTTLSLPMPGMPPIPPTGKKVSVPDVFVVTVQGDKVSQMKVDSPADGGMPAMLAQLSVKMPGM